MAWDGKRMPFKNVTKKINYMKSIKVKSGEKFNKLTVVKEVARIRRSDGGTRRIIQCKCDCGNIADVRLYRLRHGKTQSCGCLRKLKNNILTTIN